MQVVIDIPEEVLNSIKTFKGKFICKNGYDLIQGIKNSIPLPKGHGKLITEPTEEDIAKTVGGQNDFAECIRDAVKAVFDNAPTIIEADREVEDG